MDCRRYVGVLIFCYDLLATYSLFFLSLHYLANQQKLVEFALGEDSALSPLSKKTRGNDVPALLDDGELYDDDFEMLDEDTALWLLDDEQKLAEFAEAKTRGMSGNDVPALLDDGMLDDGMLDVFSSPPSKMQCITLNRNEGLDSPMVVSEDMERLLDWAPV